MNAIVGFRSAKAAKKNASFAEQKATMAATAGFICKLYLERAPSVTRGKSRTSDTPPPT